MKPFFCFYGGKWRAAPRYPAPVHGAIVEPFAGAAGYSTRYADRDVTLVEKDPVIAGLWRYLIAVGGDEILRIPLLAHDQTVDDLHSCGEVRSLVGFWLNKGSAVPCRMPSKWMRDGWRPKSFWGVEIRGRIARQVDAIKHWQIIEGDYTAAPNIAATWFIDPPYSGAAGRIYRHNALNYPGLATWCQQRCGQVMVCENAGATWLPFEEHIRSKALEGKLGKKQSMEALWLNSRT